MNWIKSNPFISTLAAITLFLSAALLFFASRGSSRYEQAKLEFEESYQGVTKSESIPLYPTAENRDGKRKTLNEYRQSIGELRELFDGYRPGEFEVLSPQAFTDRLKTANDEVIKAFEEADCTIPAGFFLGFESYRDQLAQSDATGLLDYQLKGLKHALLQLAEARPSELRKVYREAIPEESGESYQSGPNDVTRNFGFEISFKGSENASRKFLSSLGKTEPYYYVVRCVKIDNERLTPPRVEDAKFEKPAETTSAPDNSNPFGGAFSIPGEEEPAALPADEDAPPAKDDAAADDITENKSDASAGLKDSSRILAQVLGSEEVIVFVRFDLTMFLPTQELPNP
ncbi:MAG: hypothetical protein H7Y36_00625 [Armatimonadetes bacterium]|nr:hypothetical protein [Akkermansiaceae bacterium]